MVKLEWVLRSRSRLYIVVHKTMANSKNGVPHAFFLGTDQFDRELPT